MKMRGWSDFILSSLGNLKRNGGGLFGEQTKSGMAGRLGILPRNMGETGG